MTAARSYVSILFAVIMGAGYAAAAPACVIQATDCNQCGEESVCDSHLGEDGMCYCDPGHVWSEPGSSDNFDCDEIPSKPDVNACVEPHNVQVGGECFCECGWNWCSDDPADLSCCPDDSSDCQSSDTDVLSTGDDSSSGSGSTGGSSGSTGSETGMESGSGSGSGSGSESGSGEGSGSGSGSGEGSGSGSGSGEG